jgi:hypothetical protein
VNRRLTVVTGVYGEDVTTVDLESCGECYAFIDPDDWQRHQRRHDEVERGPRKPPKPSEPRPVPETLL